MIPVEALFDAEEVNLVKEDLISECATFGDIINVEIPRPATNGELKTGQAKRTSLLTYGHGKIFMKFNHVIAAKQAR